MRRNCNIDLRLVPFSEHSDHLHHPIMEEPSPSPSEQNKQLTIFYNGTVCVYDVTEMQANMILCLARGEMQEFEKSKTPRRSSLETNSTSLRSPTTPICSPSANLSLQRSLEHFLQKRKHRVQAMSPNNH
ncbi:hypothetical protein K2173_006616 [Erythroxylum novogranatense]|uniref:Protein TIFY n=1 Tax=Erythroxylum novogranatense TaxID=1862640 RepID=A0AAV8T7F8_9ROSI|nr:hypothetical protein K2173_006616 [Erythroxylum novogranatense]